MINYKQTVESFKTKPLDSFFKFIYDIGIFLILLNVFFGKETFAEKTAEYRKMIVSSTFLVKETFAEIIAEYEETRSYCSKLEASFNNKSIASEYKISKTLRQRSNCLTKFF